MQSLATASLSFPLRRLVTAFTLSTLLFPVLAAHGQTTWIVPSDDAKLWNEGSAWSNGVPGGGTDAVVDNGGNVLVDKTSNGSYGTLLLGNTSAGNLYIYNLGQLVGTNAILGANYSATPFAGTASVSTGGRWTNSGTLTIGKYGTGSLWVTDATVSNGETVIGEFNTGTVTVNSGTLATSGTLITGVRARGTLDIKGGSVTASTVTVGEEFSPFLDGGGYVTVSGGTLSSAGDLTVGNRGKGDLTISGGLVTNVNGYIGRNPSSPLPPSGVVTVTSGTWANSNNLYVGGAGTGTLNVSGGLVSNANAYLGGPFLGSAAVANVSGSGTWTTTGTLAVGAGGAGAMNITGGTVNSTEAVLGAFNPNYPGMPGSGTATVSGGTWVNSGTLRLGNGGTGKLDVSGGLVSTAQTESFNSTILVTGGTFSTTGRLNTVSGSVTVDGGLLSASDVFFSDVGGGMHVAVKSGTLAANMLSVTGSATMEVSGGLVSTTNAGISGGALITGGTWNNRSNLYAGAAANSFEIQGGYVASEMFYTAGTTVTGGTLSAAGLYVSGTLDIAGGMVSSTTGIVGYNSGSPGATGVATVSSGTWATKGLIIGYNAQGTLNLADTGTVVIDSGTGTLQLGNGQSTVNFGNGGAAGSLQAAKIEGGFGTHEVNFNHTGTATFSTQLSGNLSVNKLGEGTSTLTGLNSYTGETHVHSGTLAVASGASLGNTANIYVGETSGKKGTLVSGGVVSTGTTLVGNVEGGEGVVAVTGGSWDTDLFSVGVSSRGTLNQSGGAVTSRVASIGENASGRGAAVIGSGTWTQTENLYLAYSGTGFLTLNGGLVNSATSTISSNAGSYGVATVNSGTWNTTSKLTISKTKDSSGALLTYGGTVTTNSLVLGEDKGSNGNVNMMGGALQVAGNVTVGDYGTGDFRVENGVVTTGSHFYFANQKGSVATAYATSGSWNIGGDFVVGNFGTANLAIIGGTISSQKSIIGAERTNEGLNQWTYGVGSVRMSGGTWNNADRLVVGDYGNGTLTLTGSSVLRVANGNGTLVLGAQVGSTGILNIGEGGAAGTIEAAEITRGLTGIVPSGTAVVNINNSGTTTIAPRISGSMGLNKYGTGTAILTGSSTYSQGTRIEGGILSIEGGAIDHSAGQISVNAAGASDGISITNGFVRNDSTYLGETIGSRGSAVMNSGTWVHTSYLYIGNLGSGAYTQNGGVVSDINAYVGDRATGTAIVNSGTWNHSSALVVGSSAEGALTINDGLVSSTTGVIGNSYLGGVGTVTVNGGVWKTRDLQIGNSGTGTLALYGGVVESTNAFVGYSGGRGDIILAGTENTHGMLAINEITRIGTGSLSFDGGGVRALSDQSNWLSGFATSLVGSGGAYFDTNGHSISLGTVLGGAGGIVKQGEGTLTLNKLNALLGDSLVTGGTLAIAHSRALGNGGVRVENGTLFVNRDVSISNEVVLAGGALAERHGAGSNLAGALQAKSSFAGGPSDTSVSILAGTASIETTLIASFSAANDSAGKVYSDVLHLSGIPTVSGTTTDIFVLELSLAKYIDGTYLSWLDGSGEWVNAVLGNTGNNASLLQLGYEGSFAQFQLGYGFNLENYIGAWGFTDKGVWAVLNHNSEFAVVPEVSTGVLVGLGAIVFVIFRRRSLRRCA